VFIYSASSAFPGLPSSGKTKKLGMQSLGSLKKEMFGEDSAASSGGGGESSWLQEEYRLQRAAQAKEEAAAASGSSGGYSEYPGYHWSDARGAYVHGETGEVYSQASAAGGGAGDGKKKKGR
jgi:hypothetical protein